jgi:hypothetical protein
MADRLDRDRMETRFEALTYPVTRDDAAAAFRDVTVGVDGGEANLGRVISEVGSDAFRTAADLTGEVEAALAEEYGAPAGDDAADDGGAE